jgi:hypothetical protein
LVSDATWYKALVAPLIRAALTALALLIFLPAAARADDCSGQTLNRTFLPWGDPALYTAVPEGWSLAGNAAVVDGNEPFLPGDSSLSLPAGSSATTAPLCIGLGHPTVRFFARNTGNPLSLLRVSAVVGETELPIGLVPAGREWAPSPPLLLAVNLLGADSVAFKFAAGGGKWSVDDVYVDPYSKG